MTKPPPFGIVLDVAADKVERSASLRAQPVRKMDDGLEGAMAPSNSKPVAAGVPAPTFREEACQYIIAPCPSGKDAPGNKKKTRSGILVGGPGKDEGGRDRVYLRPVESLGTKSVRTGVPGTTKPKS